MRSYYAEQVNGYVQQPGDGPNVGELTTLDLMLTQRCPEDCDFCWALAPRSEDGHSQIIPDADYAPAWDMDPEKADKFIWESVGYIRKIVLTGGEPNGYGPLAGRVKAVHEAAAKCVISTTGLSERQLKAVDNYSPHYAIAFDGPPEVHDRVHAGRYGARRVVARAIRTMQMAEQAEAIGSFSLHTLVNRETKETITQIPEVLKAHGIQRSTLRIKLYQQAPIGRRLAAENNVRTGITTAQLIQTAIQLKLRMPGAQIVPVPWMQASHRGAYVRPNGNTYTVAINSETRLPEEVPLGNVFEDELGFQGLRRKFAAEYQLRPAFVLQDLETGAPFSFEQWVRRAGAHALDDWLAEGNPDPITEDVQVQM
jgi:MoaA/NifB/PqqE/SkfB family radical SAM enzyme